MHTVHVASLPPKRAGALFWISISYLREIIDSRKQRASALISDTAGVGTVGVQSCFVVFRDLMLSNVGIGFVEEGITAKANRGITDPKTYLKAFD